MSTQRVKRKAPVIAGKTKRLGGSTNQEQMIGKEERKAAIAALYCEGLSVEHIARTVSVTPCTVYDLLREVRTEWLERSLASYNDRKAEELAKIDRLEAEAWEAWHRSCAQKVVERTRTESVRQVPPRAARPTPEEPPAPPPRPVRGKGHASKHSMVPIRTTTEVTVHGQTGDPRFLEQVAWCIETRLRVLGALRPDTTNVQINQINWAEMTVAPPTQGAVEEVIDALEREALVTPHPSHPKVLSSPSESR